MSGFNEDAVTVLKDFANAVTEAISRVDSEGFEEAFARAQRQGATDMDINRLLDMSGEEQEHVFGKEILPDYIQQEVNSFTNATSQPMGWS